MTVLADSDALIEVFRRRNQDIAAHGAKIWTRNRKHYPMQDLAFF